MCGRQIRNNGTFAEGRHRKLHANPCEAWSTPAAARTDKRDSEVVEAALRAYLGLEVVASVWARSDLSEDEAMRLAVEETHAVRAQRRAARGS